ncbi:anti-sigma factor domain-containing protein [Roseateles asaccharophilus]|uniref:Anti-sigma-K factor RskA n=1 Tax=Roseateles asaccharophilus TaxID=582607 RepID=A0ABU2A7Y2_9BURK|nr:anti-sigma factor [Roseateles asaccharophilus]MDR7333302.1 anti-sigma-K factor RskA [Roseateles asaccharophilus]
MIDLHESQERDTAAGEYVLGTLSPEDHAAVAAALPGDGALRAAVYAWQDRLLALSAHAAAESPAPAVWQRLSLALDARTAPARRTGDAARLPWWQALRFWQGVSALAVAATLVLALRVHAPLPPAEGARFVAVLESPDAARVAGWVVELQAGGTLRLVPVGDTPPVPPGRALQFWTKAQGAAGPTSLGLVRAGQTVQMPVARLPAVEAQQLFEITLEPEAGSPIGRPTGPILFVGRTVAL